MTRKIPAAVVAKDTPKLEAAGLKPACRTETGIVGMHFQGPAVGGKSEPLIRYAVCTDVLDAKFQKRFEEQLDRLELEY